MADYCLIRGGRRPRAGWHTAKGCHRARGRSVTADIKSHPVDARCSAVAWQRASAARTDLRITYVALALHPLKSYQRYFRDRKAKKSKAAVPGYPGLKT